MNTSEPAVFFSYARADDQSEGGRISGIREKLENELRFLSGDPWHVFLDLEDIEIGQQWRKRLQEGVTGCTFFVPVLTPTYFKRPFCREELMQFLDRESEMERDDLVIPILYLNTPVLADMELQRADTLATAIAARQMDDWRALRKHSLGSARVKQRVTALAEAILATHRRLGGKRTDDVTVGPSFGSQRTNRQVGGRESINPRQVRQTIAQPSRVPADVAPTPATSNAQPAPSQLRTWIIAGCVAAILVAAGYAWIGRSQERQRDPSQSASPMVPISNETSVEVRDDWMVSAAYQKSFEVHAANGLYPVRVEGRWESGRDEFRADWRIRSAPCEMAANHGLTKVMFDQFNSKYTAEGLKITSLTKYTNGDGIIKHQVVWSKNCDP